MTFARMKRGAAALAASILWLPCFASAQPDPLVPEPADAQAEEAVLAGRAAEPEAAKGPHMLTKADVDAWLDGVMPYALEDLDIAGAVVSVVKDGELLTSRGYGYADLETQKPMDPASTLVRPGSVSKLFTWTAVMQLVEQGKVDLDEDVNAYLDFTIPEAFGAPITVRNLLTHTSGFEEAIKTLIVKDPANMPDLEKYVKESIPARVFPPGTTPAYSNYATALAGYIVQHVSGQSFDDYIDEYIFAPLGMKHSSFRQPLPDELAAMMSQGYEDVFKAEPQYYEIIPAAPAGSLAATADDMAKFMIAHLDNGGVLLSPETAEEMHTTLDPHLPPLNAMALGFYQQDHYGLRSIGHGGDTMFFHSNLSLFLDHNVGLFVSVNSSGSKGGGSLFLRERLANNFGERYFAEAAPVEETTLDTAAAHGAEIAGVYEVSRSPVTNFMAVSRFLGQAKITVDENGDLLFPFVSVPARWREVEPYVWRRVGGDERLAATIADGKVKQLSFEPVSPFMTYSPPPWHRSSALLTPLLAAAILVLGATALFWPVRAIVRARYKGAFPHQGATALSHRVVRIGVYVVLAYLIGWMALFTSMMSDISNLTAAMDAPVRIMQIAQVALYAALLAAVWNAYNVWTARSSWFAKFWSVLLPLAIIVVIWFAAISGFLSFDLTY